MRAEREAVTQGDHEHPLVVVAWLVEHLDDPAVRIVDTRFYLDGRRGADAYAAGHIPGAVFMDVERDLSSPAGSGPGRHPLPSAEVFSGALSRAGIGPRTIVVAYDDVGGAMAARLWWLLCAIGHRGGRVLDGGLAAYSRDGHPLTPDPPVIELATPMTLSFDRSRIVDRARVLRASTTGDAVLIDARASERYEGRVEPIDPKAGHIPGAFNAPFTGNLDPARGTFLEPAALAARYRAMGAADASEIIAYCGSGVTACHDILALRLAGRADAKLYEGSWSDWSSAPDLPIATGPLP